MGIVKKHLTKFNSNVRHFFVKSTRKVNKINVLMIKYVQYVDKQANATIPYNSVDCNDFATQYIIFKKSAKMFNKQ